MLARHHTGDRFGGGDDLIERNEGIEIGEGHISARDGIARGHDIFAEARSLDAVGDGIANQAEHRLKREGGSGDGLGQGAAGHGDQSARGHGSGGAARAWQPPTSAANVQRVAMKTPMRPLASAALAISFSDFPIVSAIAITAPGKAAEAPAVGAATMTPMELFTSIRTVT